MRDATTQLTQSCLSRKKRLVLVLILGAVFAALLEGAARVYIPLRGYDLQSIRSGFDRRRQQRVARQWREQDRDHPYLPYVLKASSPDVQMRGLRLTSPAQVKPPDVFRIVCLGGSTTHYGYPARLQQVLKNDFAKEGMRVEVVNAANLSYTTAESFINFSLRCVHYDPDLVIVYHAYNDAVAAFGASWQPDYSHFRRRLIANEPLIWDMMPRFLDRFAAYVQLRAWVEGQENIRLWSECINRYVPDFEHDPYHGTRAFRSNMMNIIAVARSRGTRVLLCTHVCNPDAGHERLILGAREMNDVTRSLADERAGVYLVDVDRLIPGSSELMHDTCHFRPERDGEKRLVRMIAETIRTRLDQWLGEGPAEIASAGTAMWHRRLAGETDGFTGLGCGDMLQRCGTGDSPVRRPGRHSRWIYRRVACATAGETPWPAQPLDSQASRLCHSR